MLNSSVLKKITALLLYNPFEEHFKTRRVLCIAIEKNGFGIAYVRRSITGNTETLCEFFTSSQKGYPEPEEIVTTVKTLIADRNLNPQEIILNLPDEWILSLPITLPETVLENPAEVLRYEMDRLTPFSEEEVSFDYSILQHQNKQVTIVLHLTKKSRFMPYKEAFNSAGLNIKIISFNSVSIAAVLSSKIPNKSFFLVQKTNDLFDRAIIYQNSHIYRDRCQKEDLLSVDIPVFGRVNAEKIISIGERLNLPEETIASELLPEFKGVNTPALLAAEASAFLYLKSPSRMINLLSMGIRPVKKKPLKGTLVLALLLIPVLMVFMITPLVKIKNEIKYLSEIARELKPRALEAQNMLKQKDALVARINKLREYSSAYSTLDILREITVILPDDTWLTSLVIKGTKIRLEGYSNSSTGLISLLEKSKYFKNVRFSSPTYRDVRMKKERFRIEAEIE